MEGFMCQVDGNKKGQAHLCLVIAVLDAAGF